MPGVAKVRQRYLNTHQVRNVGVSPASEYVHPRLAALLATDAYSEQWRSFSSDASGVRAQAGWIPLSSTATARVAMHSSGAMAPSVPLRVFVGLAAGLGTGWLVMVVSSLDQPCAEGEQIGSSGGCRRSPE